MQDKPHVARVLRVKGLLIKIAAVFFDDDGEVTSLYGTVLDPQPEDGTPRYVNIDMRGIPWPEKPEWLM